MRLYDALLVALILAGVPSRAHAQGAAPDIVRKKDGGILRGTIEEMVPKGEVKIVLPSGEKRSIPMSEVDFAGPASDAPRRKADDPTGTAYRLPVTVSAGEASLHLLGARPGLTLHVKSSEAALAFARCFR